MIDRFDGMYWFLSNFYPTPIEYEGLVYPSSEHAFQAAKTLSEKERLRFMRFDTSPAWAKSQGRLLTLRPDWEIVKNDIMLSILRIKFADPGLRKMLLETGTALLTEGNNWHDTYWGVCNGRCRYPHKDPDGLNTLGKLLERVRYEIWMDTIRESK